MTDQSKIAQIARDGKELLLKVAHERDALKLRNEELEEKVAAYEQRLRCEKIAMRMHERGFHSEVPFADLVDTLEKKASDKGGLESVEHAIDMVGPNMGLKIASIHEDSTSTGGSSAFEQYLFS